METNLSNKQESWLLSPLRISRSSSSFVWICWEEDGGLATHWSSRCLQGERNCQTPGQGSHGFCGGRGSEGPLDLLVHSEIRQRKSSASVLRTYLSMTRHGTKRQEKEEETPRREIWHHALELKADKQQRTFQALLHMTLSESRGNWSHRKTFVQAECWVDWSVLSITRGHVLTRNRKGISWSRLVKTWVNKLTKAGACYLRQKPSGCKHITGWKTGFVMYWENMGVTCYAANFCPPSDSLVVSGATRWPTQVSFSVVILMEPIIASLTLKCWWLLYFNPFLIFFFCLF